MWIVNGQIDGDDGHIEVSWGDIPTEDDAEKIAKQAEDLMREAYSRWFDGEPDNCFVGMHSTEEIDAAVEQLESGELDL
jgi:hypothetical protein